MRTIRRAVGIAAVLLLSTAMFTCQDPTGLIGSLETAVMAANDKFLEVVSITPTPLSLDVSTGQDVTIQFDREVDESTLSGNISIVRADNGATFGAWMQHYTPATRTLKLQLSSPLEGNTTYTVTLSRSIRGTDGSTLIEPKVWSFTTNDVIGGVFWFGEIADQNDPLDYANIALSIARGDSTVPVTISIQAASSLNVYYWLTTNHTDAINLTNATWQSVADLTFTTSYALPDEGEKTIYMRLKDSDGSISGLVERTIIVDRTAPPAPSVPVLDAADDAGPSNADAITCNSSGLTFRGTSETGATVAVKYGSTLCGTGSSNGNWTVDNVSLAQGTYDVYAVATDAAGNTGSDSSTRTVMIDTTKPAVPTSANGVVIAYEKIAWDWSAGSDPFGNLSGRYRVQVNDGSWTTVTSEAYAYTKSYLRNPLSLFKGTYSLNIQEEDVAGNWSLSLKNTVGVASSPITPTPGATGVSRTPVSDWPDYPGATGYYVYLGTGSGNYNILNKYERATSDMPKPAASLPGLTRLYWRYTVFNAKAAILYTSPEFTFTTSK